MDTVCTKVREGERARKFAMEDEIKAEFIKSGFDLQDEEAVVNKCLAFCINYNLRPSDIVSSWEVYYLNRQFYESTVNESQIDAFLPCLLNEQKEAIVEEEPDLHVYSSKDVDMILADDGGEDVNENIHSSPIDRSEDISLHPLDSASPLYDCESSTQKLVTPFARRTEEFCVRFSISEIPDVDKGPDHDIDEDDVIRKVRPRKSCSLTVHGSGPKPGCRFMYDRTEDRFDALKNRILYFTRALADSGLNEVPIDPTVATQKSLFTVGMISCDGEGRLNEKSTLLQSSVEHGGECIRLDLHQLSKYSIFPGQVVGIEGHNPSGHCLIASKLVDSAPFPSSDSEDMHRSKKQARDNETDTADETYNDKELSMIIAAGPFTTTDNMLFQPLTELLSNAKKKMPQLLILLGPFVDSEHPEIKRGTLERNFEGIFNLEILRRLQDYAESMGSNGRVIVVPSIRDANHDFVFPQPTFDINLPHLQEQITSISNPGIFEANHVRIACCTVDILKHLSAEEISRFTSNGKPNDRMSRLVNHVLNQKSFYPLYPPAEGVPFDFSLTPEAIQIPFLPDILILPSDIKFFVKVLSRGESDGKEDGTSRCICVNPGRLSKGEGGGTFVELEYRRCPGMINASIIGL